MEVVGDVAVGDTAVVGDPVKSGVEEPPELPGGFGFAGGEVEGVGTTGEVEPGEPVGTGGVDEDGPLIIVNSGLAFPESPNTVMSVEHGTVCSSVAATYRQRYSLTRWGHQVP